MKDPTGREIQYNIDEGFQLSPEDEYDPHEDEDYDIFLETFDFALREMARIYEMHREQKGDSWQDLPVNFLRNRLYQEYEEYSASDCNTPAEYNELLDILNVGFMLVVRLSETRNDWDDKQVDRALLKRIHSNLDDLLQVQAVDKLEEAIKRQVLVAASSIENAALSYNASEMTGLAVEGLVTTIMRLVEAHLRNRDMNSAPPLVDLAKFDHMKAALGIIFQNATSLECSCDDSGKCAKCVILQVARQAIGK